MEASVVVLSMLMKMFNCPAVSLMLVSLSNALTNLAKDFLEGCCVLDSSSIIEFTCSCSPTIGLDVVT